LLPQNNQMLIRRRENVNIFSIIFIDKRAEIQSF